jgi:hypothetical protein
MGAATFIRVVSLRKQLGKVNAALRKKGLKPKRRAELLAQKAQILQGITSAQDAYTGSLPDPADTGDTGTGDDGNQALIDSNNALAEAIQNLATQNADLAKAQNDATAFSQSLFNSQTGAVMAAIADISSRQIGGMVGRATLTPGFAGGRSRY